MKLKCSYTVAVFLIIAALFWRHKVLLPVLLQTTSISNPPSSQFHQMTGDDGVSAHMDCVNGRFLKWEINHGDQFAGLSHWTHALLCQMRDAMLSQRTLVYPDWKGTHHHYSGKTGRRDMFVDDLYDLPTIANPQCVRASLFDQCCLNPNAANADDITMVVVNSTERTATWNHSETIVYRTYSSFANWGYFCGSCWPHNDRLFPSFLPLAPAIQTTLFNIQSFLLRQSGVNAYICAHIRRGDKLHLRHGDKLVVPYLDNATQPNVIAEYVRFQLKLNLTTQSTLKPVLFIATNEIDDFFRAQPSQLTLWFNVYLQNDFAQLINETMPVYRSHSNLLRETLLDYRLCSGANVTFETLSNNPTAGQIRHEPLYDYYISLHNLTSF